MSKGGGIEGGKKILTGVALTSRMNEESINELEDMLAEAEVSIRQQIAEKEAGRLAGIVVFGREDVGKTTAIHLMNSPEKVQMKDNVNTGETEVHTDADTTPNKIPKGYYNAKEKLFLWEMPRFADQDRVQHYANLYFIKRITELFDKLKILFVCRDADLGLSGAGKDATFRENLANLTKTFKHLSTGLHLGITVVPEGIARNEEQIKNRLIRIKEEDTVRNLLDQPSKDLIQLLTTGSKCIHIFKPQTGKSPYLLGEVISNNQFTTRSKAVLVF